MRARWLGLMLLAVASPAAAERQSLALDPQRTEVSFDLEATGHDVHGVVGLETGELSFDAETGDVDGEIVLDARRSRTGNSSRDRTLRDDVFEVAEFPRIRFLPERFTGVLALEGSSEIVLHGEIELHGARHALEIPATVVRTGTRLTTELGFQIPYQDWGLRDPSILFLRVARVVAVHVHAEGALTETPAAVAALRSE